MKNASEETTKEKLSFSHIEILIIIVLLALIIVSGLTVFSITTKNKKVDNFRSDAEVIVSAAKNAYALFTMNDKTDQIVTSTDGNSRGMCITLKGLYANELLTDSFEDWSGYIVIEESASHKFNYTAWITNKNYVIEGYDSTMIHKLKLGDGITIYNDDDFEKKVTTSFAGTTSDKGGTGTKDNYKRYEGSCINEKIE